MSEWLPVRDIGAWVIGVFVRPAATGSASKISFVPLFENQSLRRAAGIVKNECGYNEGYGGKAINLLHS